MGLLRMSSLTDLPIGFTLGDANGIGPEIIVKLFAAGLPHAALVYGDAGVLEATIAQLGLENKLDIELVSDPDLLSTQPGIIPVLNRWQALPDDLVPGQLNALAGRGAYEYLCHAIDDALAGKLRAIVTAPLNKKAMQAGGIDYPGTPKYWQKEARQRATR